MVKLSSQERKRIVLFFDDVAHIGRERSLSEFFVIFRILSGSSISCKAAIYPGVENFGTCFDILNDATVIDVSRDETSKYFTPLFLDVIKARYKNLLDTDQTDGINKEDSAKFLGRYVIGNMRAFVYLCNKIQFEKKIGLNELTNSLLYLSSDYYWPLVEELAPKLGNYEPLIETGRKLAEKIFGVAGKSESASVIIHSELVRKFQKPFELLEYTGFVSRREASRAMKSGGRGSRFSLNLCNLLEIAEGKKLTQERFYKWLNNGTIPAEIHANSNVLDIEVPEMPYDEMEKLPVLSLPVDKLAKSKVYPYGLTPDKIDVLKDNNITTIEELAESSDETLLSVQGIGEKFLKRIRDVVGQAIWM
ncbi:MAG: helix-hairpin-helix domain-containing protein [Desulfobacteraceae bacterium]|nr:helix-hairpin-helix domain-containing protein [Desulfobacteraceae bacterium]